MGMTTGFVFIVLFIIIVHFKIDLQNPRNMATKNDQDENRRPRSDFRQQEDHITELQHTHV